MKAKKWGIIGGVIIFLIAAGIFVNYYFLKTEGKENFELDTLFLKVSINEGGATVNNIRITNTGGSQERFSVKVSEIGDIINLDEKEFDVAPQESYNLKVTFNGEDIDPGVYLGELEVSSIGKRIIPIILEIQSKEVLFDSQVNLFPIGREVIPGEKINAEIKIFDLANIGTSNVESIYLIKDFKGGTVISEADNLVVDNKLSLTKTIDLSSSIRLGDYVLINIVKYDDSVGTSSVLFKVAEKKTAEGFSEKTFMYIIILFGFFFLVFLVLFIYSIFYRDKIFKELQNQYQRELRRQNALIREQEKVSYAKLKTSAEKKEYKKAVEKIKEKRLKALREIQKRRLEEYKKIKKSSTREQLEKQIRKWRDGGYDTSILEKKYKLPDAEEIREKLGRQLAALEEARKEGFVSYKSYKKGKKRIKNLNKKIGY